jgi:hypothetical protein
MVLADDVASLVGSLFRIIVRPGYCVRDSQVQQFPQESVPVRIRRWALAAFIRVYPWIHASQEALQFTYQLLYLLDSTPFFSPALHLLRQTVVRVSGNELVHTCLSSWQLPPCCGEAPEVGLMSSNALSRGYIWFHCGIGELHKQQPGKLQYVAAPREACTHLGREYLLGSARDVLGNCWGCSLSRSWQEVFCGLAPS